MCRNWKRSGRLHNVGLSSPEAPSYQAFKHIGKVFHEFDTDSSAMIVLEGDKPLGADAHRFYDALIHKLEQDKKHVQHVQDFWGDTLTAAGSQSSDGKAAYVQLFLAGAQGEAAANESVDAVRATVDHMQPPQGVKAYLTGAAPLIADQFTEGSKGSKQSHRDDRRGDRGDVVFRLSIVRHYAPGSCHGPYRDGRGTGIRCVPWAMPGSWDCRRTRLTC